MPQPRQEGLPRHGSYSGGAKPGPLGRSPGGILGAFLPSKSPAVLLLAFRIRPWGSVCKRFARNSAQADPAATWRAWRPRRTPVGTRTSAPSVLRDGRAAIGSFLPRLLGSPRQSGKSGGPAALSMCLRTGPIRTAKHCLRRPFRSQGNSLGFFQNFIFSEIICNRRPFRFSFAERPSRSGECHVFPPCMHSSSQPPTTGAAMSTCSRPCRLRPGAYSIWAAVPVNWAPASRHLTTAVLATVWNRSPQPPRRPPVGSTGSSSCTWREKSCLWKRAHSNRSPWAFRCRGLSPSQA